MEQEKDHHHSRDEAPCVERIGAKLIPGRIPSFDIDGINSPCGGVHDRLDDHDATNPPMEEVVGVETDV